MTITPASPRYIELDALRGFAVMGILLMNIIGFAMPDMAYFSPAIYGGTDTPDIVSWTLSFLLVDGKMRGLFTLLFGASMMLVIERAEAKGQSSAKVHYSRMGWLTVFGLFHFFFIWWGDILFLYAVVGCVAYLMTDMKAEKLWRYGLLFYLSGFIAYAVMMGSLFFLEYQAGLPNASAATQSEFAEVMSEFGLGEAGIAEQIALFQSGYLNIVTTHLTESAFDPILAVIQNCVETLPFMMFGMALYKQGFFTGEWDNAKYRQWGVRMTLLGLIILVPIAIYLISVDFEILRVLNAGFAWTMPSRLLMTVGYAALLILLIKRFANAFWMHRIAAVGRAAFTNYLGTSIAMTFVFYGWGLGHYGQVGRAELYLLVIAAWIVMLFWSKPWLMRFRFGPLEWLWRSLARWQLQPMKIGK